MEGVEWHMPCTFKQISSPPQARVSMAMDEAIPGLSCM